MKYLKSLLFLLILIPFNVSAYVGALDEGSFYINNQTTSPFSLTISGNSNVTASFHLVWDWYHGGDSNIDLPGSYLFFSIVSDKKIDIERSHAFGNFCTQSCFSNDKYLQLVESDGSSYSYVFYFNIVKWARNVGTQVDLFNVDDQFKFINKESGTAHVYIYGAYSSATNEIPNLINDVNTLQQIIINGETNAEWIIDNQNQNTEEIIDSQKACNKIDFDDVEETGKVFNSNGGFVTAANTFGITDFIKIDYPIYVTKEYDYWPATCFYNSYKTLISCVAASDMSLHTYLTIPNNAYYVRFSLNINNGPNFSMCDNGNQMINDNLNDLNDNMTDSSIDSPSGDFGDMEDMIAENGVITQLISLPITLYSHILNSVNGTCTSYNLGQLYGTDITFSCISLQSLLGSTLWGVIDILFSGFAIYKISKKMIKVFNNFSGLQEGDVIDD